jgi:glycosyltransferase involved in cell wall biosynthesis
MISVVIPYYAGMKNAEVFMERCLKSIKEQTYTDYEIVINDEGSAGDNLNAGITKAKGDIITIICMDDYFAHRNTLKDIAERLTGAWLIAGCNNNPTPYYTGDVHQGNNKLGGLSAITVRKENFIPFDGSLKWLVDCDFYKKMYAVHGSPDILNGVHIMIGEGEHQATNMLSEAHKRYEIVELTKRYAGI